MHIKKIMNKNLRAPLFFSLVLGLSGFAGLAQTKAPKTYTHADTLRGSLTPERTWWDVKRYELSVTPDFNNKSITGSNEILYKVVKPNDGSIRLQLDLQAPLVIDSVVYNGGKSLTYTQDGNVWYVTMP